MKRVLSVFGLVLALALAHPALAFDTPQTDEATKTKIGTMGTAYQRYATALGFSDFAWGDLSAKTGLYTLKYIGPKDTLATARTMVLITVYGLSGDKDADDAKMASTVKMLGSWYRTKATMVDDKVLDNPLDEKTWFTQFYTGTDPNVTYTAGAYIRTNTKPSEAAFIQLQSREAIAPEKALILYQLVNPQATLPPKKKKAFDPTAPLTPQPESIAK